MKNEFGLLGEKLGHSYSKVIHEMLGYEYRLIEKKEDEVAAFISARNFNGLNVTIPYKKTVMGFCDEVSDLALRIGAVNTLYFAEASSSDRILCGTNTDYEGLRFALEQADISLMDKKVLILGGTGGAGSMAKVLAVNEGAREIVIASRKAYPREAGSSASYEVPSIGGSSSENVKMASLENNKIASSENAKMASLENDIIASSENAKMASLENDKIASSENTKKASSEIANISSSQIKMTDYEHLPLDAEIIINATPVGTYPDIEKSPVDLACFENCIGVCDLIYNPLRTALLMQAEKRGIKYTNGLPMLVRQATAAAEYFHGNGEYLSRTEEILSRLEKQTENIVLIGMPGCGKSSIGKILSKRTGRTLKDTDAAVKEMFGRTPAEIIKEDGEASFREKESLAVASLAKEHSLIIATGGGAVKNPHNVDLLKQNGRIFFIDRDPDLLSTFNRPLSQNGGVYRIYDERYPIYSSCCDHRIKNNGEDFSVCADAILSYY